MTGGSVTPSAALSAEGGGACFDDVVDGGISMTTDIVGGALNQLTTNLENEDQWIDSGAGILNSKQKKYFII